MKPHISEAKPEDAPQLSILLEQLGYPTTESETLFKFNLYTQPEYKLLVAKVESTVLGFIALHYYQSFHLPGPVGRITSFCVDENMRGFGGWKFIIGCYRRIFLRQQML